MSILDPKGRPISERRTDLASSDDIKRRLLFVLVALGGPVGVILGLYGMTRERAALAAIGGLLVVAAVFGWWRGRSSFNESAEEIRKNPFKPRREPKE